MLDVLIVAGARPNFMKVKPVLDAGGLSDQWVPEGVELVELTREELAVAAITVLVVDHDCFDADLIVDAAQQVLDCRNVLTGSKVELL